VINNAIYDFLISVFVDFIDKRGIWSKERRAIYLKPFVNDKGETLLPFAREDNERIIYTNLGNDEELDEQFIKSKEEEYFKVRVNHRIIP